MDDLLNQKRSLDSGVANTRLHGGRNAGRGGSGYCHERGVLTGGDQDSKDDKIDSRDIQKQGRDIT